MKLFILTFATLFSYQITLTKAWGTIFEEKHELLEKYSCQFLTKQFNAFIKGDSPIIADARIKSIVIEECNEPIIDLCTVNHKRIFMLPNPAAPFSSPDCNSGFKCASMMRKALFDKLVIMINYIDLLAPEFGYNSGEINIGVFEALRDVKTQEQLFQNKLNEIKAANPDFTEEQLNKEASKWVSPTKNNIPVHSTGAAIDIRLIYNNRFIDMGKFGVIWGANPNAPTFSEDITSEQKLNRLLLLIAATMADLTNYAYEFWHFSTGDRYYEYWKNSTLKIAKYGSVKVI